MNKSTVESLDNENLNQQNLGGLQFNQSARILSVQSKNLDVQCRLLTLGLYPGVKIEVLRRAPMGDPLQVRSGTTLLSIRQHEAEGIIVELL
jgi:ferrous iron transport protein A